MPRHAVATVVFGLGLLSGCATTSDATPKDGITGLAASDVTGGMVQHRTRVDTPISQAAAFGRDSVAVTAGAAHSARLDRTATGTWTGGVGLVSGYRFPEKLNVDMAFDGNRITGPSINVLYTPIPGGFRLDGLWFGENVRLEMNTKYAQVRSDRWVRDAAGNYVSPDLSTMEFLGEAARIESPTMPQMALMLLLFGWGVR
jgi:hypothetical protein